MKLIMIYFVAAKNSCDANTKQKTKNMNLCQACFTVLNRFEQLKLSDNWTIKKNIQLLV